MDKHILILTLMLLIFSCKSFLLIKISLEYAKSLSKAIALPSAFVSLHTQIEESSATDTNVWSSYDNAMEVTLILCMWNSLKIALSKSGSVTEVTPPAPPVMNSIMSERDSTIVSSAQPIKGRFLLMVFDPISLISPSEPTPYVVFPILEFERFYLKKKLWL